MASSQQLYAVSLAMAAVVVLLWRGPLMLLAAGALFLGLVIALTAVFLVVARRSRSAARPNRSARERWMQ